MRDYLRASHFLHIIWLWIPVFVHLPLARVTDQMNATIAVLYVGARNLNSSLPACMEDTLLTEPLP